MAWSDAARKAAAAARKRGKTQMGRIENFFAKQIALSRRGKNEIQTIVDNRGVRSRWVKGWQRSTKYRTGSGYK